jgi:hypothetical protein
MRVFLLLMTVASLSACSWFHSKRHEAPDPTELIVTGAPVNSIVYLDGSKTEQPTPNNHPQILMVTAGDHKVEIQVGEKIVYREEIYVGPGEHRVVTVLSGFVR